jgi:hypothetical protein
MKCDYVKMKNKLGKILNILNIFFIKTFLGWLTIAVAVFFITYYYNNEFEKALIYGLAIVAIGSLIYSWRQAYELTKKADLDLYFNINDNLLKDITIKDGSVCDLTLAIYNNDKQKYASNFAFTISLPRQKNFEISILWGGGLTIIDSTINGVPVRSLNYLSQPHSIAYPGINLNIGTIRIKTNDIQESQPFKCGYKIMSTDMDKIKYGELNIHIIK